MSLCSRQYAGWPRVNVVVQYELICSPHQWGWPITDDNVRQFPALAGIVQLGGDQR